MLELQLRPFQVPNFVSAEMAPQQRQDGVTFSGGFPLSTVSAEKLSEMCDEFRAKIFEKAGKKDPNFERKP